LDKKFVKRAEKKGWRDGTTAVVALVIRQESLLRETYSSLAGAELYVANTGDSRCLLIRNGRPIQLSEEHKPNRADEKARIEDNGGRVVLFGTWRVEGVLAVSRAIGDQHLKK